MRIDVLVEGMTDAAVARKVLQHTGHTCGQVYGQRGFDYVQKKVEVFNQKSLFGDPVLTMVDFMDTRLDCPAAVVTDWLPTRSPRHLLRVVVPELESWLLADREAIAGFFGVTLSRVPSLPEDVPDPKQSLIRLARQCRTRSRREAMVPRPGISASTGPGYASEIEAFVRDHWNVMAARRRSPSLHRCLVRLGEFQP